MAGERSTAAFQGFLVEAKRYWMSEIWGALKDDYRERVHPGHEPKTAEEVAALMAPSPLYWFYAWLERHIQRAKYSGRYGLTVSLRDASVHPPAGARLDLDGSVGVPDYYSAVDTHQHPGNLVAGPNAGLVYRASAGLHPARRDARVRAARALRRLPGRDRESAPHPRHGLRVRQERAADRAALRGGRGRRDRPLRAVSRARRHAKRPAPVRRTSPTRRPTCCGPATTTHPSTS